MMKQVLTGLALILFGLVCSVRGDDGFPRSHTSYESLADLFAGFKEHCPEQENNVFCYYWNSNKLPDYRSSEGLKSKQWEERGLGNKDGGRETPEEKSRESVIEFPENHPHKRFLMPRRKNPTARGYKRGPGFRSWGGKRDSVPSRQDQDTRAKFGPWGGKRNEEYFPDDSFRAEEVSEKRAKFQNWGGKRSDDEPARSPTGKRGSIWKERRFFLREPFKKDVPKRPQFQSWGGKRASHPWYRAFGFLNPQPSGYSMTGGEKRKFSSWGGKRNEYTGADVMGQGFQNWEEKKLGSDGGLEELSSGKKWIFDDNDPQRSKSLKASWGSGALPFDSDAWGDKGGDENNTR